MLVREIAAMKGLLGDTKMAAVMMENCPAWVIVDLACVAAQIPLLPLPAFFSQKQISHALTNAGVDTVFTDQFDRFDGYVENIVIGGMPYYRVTLTEPKVSLPAHTAKITYTSGTTDEPKGVCLTQNAMETVAHSLLCVIKIPPVARHVCLLPLAVLLENVAGVYPALLAGATICLPPVKHEPEALHAAITDNHGTSCILVPELLRMLLAIDKRLPSLSYVAVGGARVSAELVQFALFKGIPVYEGYGLSEASSVIAVNTPDAYKIGSAGKILPHIKLDVNGNGEILLRHPLFSGYLGDDEPGHEWYATGDIGQIDDDGFVFIEGRKKNIYITSFGRNVSPEWVESLLTAHPSVAQAVVYGEDKPFSTAVIVAHQPQDIPAAIQHINEQLPDYARIGTHILASAPFSIANGQLTGTGRPKRMAIYNIYEEAIEASYIREVV
jgi:long-chain acyl-CoA synthetase